MTEGERILVRGGRTGAMTQIQAKARLEKLRLRDLHFVKDPKRPAFWLLQSSGVTLARARTIDICVRWLEQKMAQGRP